MTFNRISTFSISHLVESAYARAYECEYAMNGIVFSAFRKNTHGAQKTPLLRIRPWNHVRFFISHFHFNRIYNAIFLRD